jgi:hypothetical protein
VKAHRTGRGLAREQALAACALRPPQWPGAPGGSRALRAARLPRVAGPPGDIGACVVARCTVHQEGRSPLRPRHSGRACGPGIEVAASQRGGVRHRRAPPFLKGGCSMFHLNQRKFTSRWIAGLLAGLACFASVGESVASASVVDIRIGPPATRAEAPPRRAPRHRVWTNGYWAWNGHRHVWVPGRYVPERRGHAWRQARWEHTRHGKWRFHEGGWYRHEREHAHWH